MTAPILPSVSPAAPASSMPQAGQAASDSGDAPRFSDVLSQQGAARQAHRESTEQGSAKPSGHGAGKAKATQDDDASARESADAGTDAALAAGLPGIALQIAAQASAVIERAQHGVRTAPSGASASGARLQAIDAADATADKTAQSLPTADAATRTAAIAAADPVSDKASAGQALLADRAQPAAAATAGAAIMRKPVALSGAIQGNAAAGSNASRTQGATAAEPDALALASAASAATAFGSTAQPVDAAAAAQGIAGSIHATAAAAPLPLQSAPVPTGAGAIPVPLHHPQWSQSLGQEVMQLAHAGKHAPQVAELRLDPPELGPLRIAIQISDNVAHAVFVSAHANVRNAIENALPQLQEQLAQAGISLGQTSVNDQGSPSQAFQSGSDGRNGNQGGNGLILQDGGSAELADASASRRPASDALIDTFA